MSPAQGGCNRIHSSCPAKMAFGWSAFPEAFRAVGARKLARAISVTRKRLRSSRTLRLITSLPVGSVIWCSCLRVALRSRPPTLRCVRSLQRRQRRHSFSNGSSDKDAVCLPKRAKNPSSNTSQVSPAKPQQKGRSRADASKGDDEGTARATTNRQTNLGTKNKGRLEPLWPPTSRNQDMH